MILVIRIKAEAWIGNHRLAGTLGAGVYERVHEPSTAKRKSSLVIEEFSFAARRHHHCENGVL
jgi:hypothetical protein